MAQTVVSQPHSRSQRRHDRRELQTRIERAIRKLPLSEADIAAVASQLASELIRLRSDRSWHDSAFFDIRGKVTAVCNHFASEGLTLEDYARAARRHPELFVKAPASLIANVETVARHFQPHGLTLRSYLLAALRSPPLFAMSSATVIANVEAAASRFAGDGLTMRQYLQAVLRQPQLFYQSPATISATLAI